MAPKAEDTYYWYSLTDKERKGRRGRDFKAFWKEWTKGLDKPIKSLVYENREYFVEDTND